MLGGGTLATAKGVAVGAALVTPVGLGFSAHHKLLADNFASTGVRTACASSDAVSGERPLDLSSAAHDLAERPNHFGGTAGRVVMSVVIGNGRGAIGFSFFAIADVFGAAGAGTAQAGERATDGAMSDFVGAAARRVPEVAER
jgi:hypothetical protein